MRGRRRERAVLALGWLALAAPGGCVAGERGAELCDPQHRADEPQPALRLELAWDTQPDDERFAGGSCELAGVADMRWELYSEDGEPFFEGESPCRDSLGLCDLPAGNYVLQVDGLDADGTTRWAARCEELLLVRFDTLYRCNIASK